MKKLFFSTALAIVAIGGAVTSAQAVDFYKIGESSVTLRCNTIDSPTCNAQAAGTSYSLTPANQGPQTPADLTEYSYPL